MEIEVSSGRYREAAVDALAVAVFKDERADEGFLRELNDAVGGILADVVGTDEFKGKEGETAYIHLAQGGQLTARRLLLVGVGEKQDYRPAAVSQWAGTAVRALRSRGAKAVGFVPRAADLGPEQAAASAIEGAIIGLFETDKYRTVDKDERRIERLLVIEDGDEAALRRGAERGRVIGEAVNLARDLANEPSVFMTPTILAERAKQVAEECGLEFDALDPARMEQEGMGALLAVARGSEEPARLIVLRYTPKGKKKGDGLLALVGKGVTFDTGGISIKPSEGMDQMKYDMSGGAAVIAAMRAIAQLGVSIPVLGVVPAVENMPSGRAYKPGDVLRSMSGKTIEVLNTDAEGRLILADAIAYAKKLGATRVVDAATLTGAVSIALGDVNAAVLGTDQQLVDEIIEAGREVGEKFWQLPLDKEYSKQIKSDIADIKNVGGRKAGTITAAAFIKEFTEGLQWAHLDIAGTAWADEAKPYRAKGPTGLPVRTFIRLVEKEAAKQ